MQERLGPGMDSLNNPFKNHGDTHLSHHALSPIALETINQMCRTEFVGENVSAPIASLLDITLL